MSGTYVPGSLGRVVPFDVVPHTHMLMPCSAPLEPERQEAPELMLSTLAQKNQCHHNSERHSPVLSLLTTCITAIPQHLLNKFTSNMTSPISGRPLPSSFDDEEEFHNESGVQKVMRRMKREPLVPLGMLYPQHLSAWSQGLSRAYILSTGCLLTVAAFTNAYRAMRKGDHQQVQRMFRARVLAQAFTIVAIAAGGLYFGAERNKEREAWKVQQDQKAEDKRQKWIRELEARDEEEKELRARLDKRREKKKAADADAAREAFRAAEAKAQDEGDVHSPGVDGGNAAGSSSGWGVTGWLSGSNSKGS